MPSPDGLDADIGRWEFILAEGTFEESLAALEEIVQCLDAGRLGLDRSIRCYELGVLMARRCEKMLNDAELRISRIDGDEILVDTE